MSKQQTIKIASYGGQDYIVKDSTDGRLILKKITLSTEDQRTPLYMYTDEELLNEFMLRATDRSYHYRKTGDNDADGIQYSL